MVRFLAFRLSRSPDVEGCTSGRGCDIVEVLDMAFLSIIASETSDRQRNPFREQPSLTYPVGTLQEPETRGSNPPLVSRSLQIQCAPALVTAPKYR
jgi:hypothetical protein